MARRPARPSLRPATRAVDEADEGRDAACDPEVLRAFLEYGRDVALWHRDRNDAHERRAASTIGFAGATLALMGTFVGPLRSASDAAERTATAFAAIGVVLLLGAAVVAALALTPRAGHLVDTDWLVQQLEQYISERHLDVAQVNGAFARSWIGRPDREHSALRDMAANANRRGFLARLAGLVLLGGVACIAIAVLVVLLTAA